MTIDVTSEQVRRFRLAATGITEPAGRASTALGSWTVQESPPGAATTAMLARTSVDVAPGWLDDAISDRRSVASFYNARTATSILRKADAPVFATALIPSDDAGFKAIVVNALPERKSEYASPVEEAVEAIAEILDGRELSRDDLHEELRGRLPKASLPWCEGCQSHHARRGLLVMASLHGKLCIAGKAGRAPLFARSDQWLGGWDAFAANDAGRALVDHFLAAFGPATPAEFADWAGLGKTHAKALWALEEEGLVEVTVDGGKPRWIRAVDQAALEDSPAPDGARLLGPGDPILQARDREVTVADAGVRKKLWTAIPTTGLAIHGSDAFATWKAKKSGKRLDLTLATFAKVPRGAKAAIEEQAERLAPHRGATSVAVSWD
ncbi:MAG: winged helix DNA-binding domain-containing protein [Solirubrobacteraceae bacterium]|nr:winged helix DNA-binding domain-containing protein [Solirubrobacteraceae bacterium]